MRPEASEEFIPLPQHYARCFGCGQDHPTGLKLRVEGGDTSVRGSFVVTEHHQGAPGLAHGGVLAAAVDEAMGFVNWMLGTTAVTARLEVDYRRPVPVGSTLELEGEVEKIEDRKIFVRIKGYIEDEVALEARSIFVRVGLDHFLPHVDGSDIDIERPYNP